MSDSHDREIIGGHLLVIGGAEDKYNERRILRKFLSLAGEQKAENLDRSGRFGFPGVCS
jgi:cyanophycinase-like exopeptidase